MRVWDINPGYLARQSLLGEHNEIHGISTALGREGAGYSNHPETRRWRGRIAALVKRHDLLVTEMTLRGYKHHSPLNSDEQVKWPDSYVDRPADQLVILREKYADGRRGRIPLPGNAQQLWAQHKYSVMARSQAAYKEIGRAVAGSSPLGIPAGLAQELVELLRQEPDPGGFTNAVLHMWGYVSELAAAELRRNIVQELDQRPALVLQTIHDLAVRGNVSYLLHSTALSDLAEFARSSGLAGSFESELASVLR